LQELNADVDSLSELKWAKLAGDKTLLLSKSYNEPLSMLHLQPPVYTPLYLATHGMQGAGITRIIGWTTRFLHGVLFLNLTLV